MGSSPELTPSCPVRCVEYVAGVSSAKPLDGVLVVSIEQAVAGPLASCRLADAGARVIKIERAEGDFSRGYDAAADGLASYFAWLNRGKESIVLDLKDAQDQALLGQMVERADVCIQNLAVGAASRLGWSKFLPRSAACLGKRSEDRPGLLKQSVGGGGTSLLCRCRCGGARQWARWWWALCRGQGFPRCGSAGRPRRGGRSRRPPR